MLADRPVIWTGNPRTEIRVNDGLSLWVRESLCDETVIEEVIGRDSYKVRDVDLTGQTVVDCGAHIGVFATMCAQQGAAHVIAIEPQPENLELLLANTEGWPNIEIRPVALGASEGIALIAGESGGAHVEPGHEDAIEVPQTTLAAILDSVGTVAVLKLDMEGSEVDVLLACDHDRLARCQRIVFESHGPISCPWLTRPRVGEVIEHLLYTHNVEAAGYPSRLGMVHAVRNGVNGGW